MELSAPSLMDTPLGQRGEDPVDGQAGRLGLDGGQGCYTLMSQPCPWPLSEVKGWVQSP